MDAQQIRQPQAPVLGLGAAAAVVAVVVGVLVLTGDDDEPVATDGTTTTTTTAESTTTTTDDDHHDGAVPDASTPTCPCSRIRRRRSASTTRSRLATAFATDFVGFSDPVVGEFQQGDAAPARSRCGASPRARRRWCCVRQLEDDTWYVIGATTDSIRLATPRSGDTITLAAAARPGRPTPSRAPCRCGLYADGMQEPIGETFVTGRGDGVLGDFTGELDVRRTPPAPPTACWC